MNYRVLDISAYQGEVDFAKVKSDGIWGVMLKATEGERYLSPAFDKNNQKATDSGLYVGAYHYLRASTPAEARKEAQFFLQKVKQAPAPAACGGHRGAGAAADCGTCPHRKGLLRRGGEKQILRHDLQHGQLVPDQARFEPAGRL